MDAVSYWGSIASLVGLPVSFIGLAFAIWQLWQLRGEARAAREAAEETRQTVRRDLTVANLNRIME